MTVNNLVDLVKPEIPHNRKYTEKLKYAFTDFVNLRSHTKVNY